MLDVGLHAGHEARTNSTSETPLFLTTLRSNWKASLSLGSTASCDSSTPARMGMNSGSCSLEIGDGACENEGDANEKLIQTAPTVDAANLLVE